MGSRETKVELLRKTSAVVAYMAILTCIYLIERHSYLLFHSIVELFSVCVAGAIFMIVWNGRSFIQNNYMLFLGIAYLFVAGFDLLHMLAYSGMGVFAERGTNLATQLWIAGRYVESASLLLAPLFLKRRINHAVIMAVYALLSTLVLLSVFHWDIFPACFREETGLTLFKEVSEYIVIAILLVSLVALWQKRNWFESTVLTWVSWSIVLTMGSELLFTLYARPDGKVNMAGHFLKLISFFLIYKALIETGMRQPHTLLYRRLKQHEAELENAQKELEERVRQRTADLSHVVESLKEEVDERMRAEEAYRDSERKHRRLVEQIPAVTYVAALDEVGSTIYVSPQAESILGFSPADFAHDPGIWARQIHPEDRERVLTKLAEARAVCSPFTSEYRFLTRDHRVVWLRDEAVIVEDEHGSPLYLQGVTYDVTKERLMQQELVEQGRTLEALFQHIILPLVILDRNFNFIRVNEAYAKACQRQISEFPGHNHFEFYPHEENQRIFQEVVRTKKAYQAVAKPFTFPDHAEWGVTYWDWTLVPILDDSDNVEFLVFSLKDVTVRRRAELALREKETLLRTVVSNAPVILFATDREGNVTVSEGRGLTAIGRKGGASVGSNVFDQYADHPDILENMRRSLAGEDVAAEVEVVPGRFFDVRYAPVRDEENRVVGVMGVAVDVTEAKENREKVIAHQERLRALTAQLLTVEDQERRKIGIALHDSVGQILAFLKIELGTMQRQELPEEAAHSLAHVREQVEEAIKQTRSLTFDISPPELYTLGLESALEELAQRFGKEKHLGCYVHAKGDLPDMDSHVKSLLYRSVRELLVNAAKHARASTVEIDLDRSNDSIHIAVRDDGTGFDTAVLDRSTPGTTAGFGLFSVKERLEYIGGTFEIHSSPGNGTRVALVAPLQTHFVPPDRSEDR